MSLWLHNDAYFIVHVAGQSSRRLASFELGASYVEVTSFYDCAHMTTTAVTKTCCSLMIIDDRVGMFVLAVFTVRFKP